MSGHLRTLINPSVGFTGARRDPMSGLEMQQALTLKARYRCGWQVVADMLGRNTDDVRRVCEGRDRSVASAREVAP